MLRYGGLRHSKKSSQSIDTQGIRDTLAIKELHQPKPSRVSERAEHRRLLFSVLFDRLFDFQ